MTLAARQDLVGQSGAAETTSCVITLHSHSNAAASVVCNGSTYTINTGDWVQAGTDYASFPQACYKAQVTVTLPAAFGRYSYTMTQGVNVQTRTLMNKPGASDDFVMFHVGCDNHSASASAFYTHIRNYDSGKNYKGQSVSGNLPVACILKNGDLGYVDNLGADDTAGTGLHNSASGAAGWPQVTGKVFDYTLAYMCCLGMLGDTNKANIAWGRDDDRVYCEQNFNIVPQWDDHEFAQDAIGTNSQFAPGKAAWNLFYGPLQPTASIKSADLVSNHWGYTIGCVRVVSTDEITSAVQGTGSGWNAWPFTMDAIYGTAQINDVLNALNTSDPFKLILTNNSTRYLGADTAGHTYDEYNRGAQHPVYNSCLPEYRMLWTVDSSIQPSPLSIMANPKTNGTAGILVNLNSDLHQQIVQWNHKPAYTNNLAEGIHHIATGGNNGPSTHYLESVTLAALQAAEAAGKKYTYDDCTVEYCGKWPQSSTRFGLARIEVYGSKPQKEMHIILSDDTGNEVWHGRWIERSSNYGVPASWQAPNISMGGSL